MNIHEIIDDLHQRATMLNEAAALMERALQPLEWSVPQLPAAQTTREVQEIKEPARPAKNPAKEQQSKPRGPYKKTGTRKTGTMTPEEKKEAKRLSNQRWRQKKMAAANGSTPED